MKTEFISVRWHNLKKGLRTFLLQAYSHWRIAWLVAIYPTMIFRRRKLLSRSQLISKRSKLCETSACTKALVCQYEWGKAPTKQKSQNEGKISIEPVRSVITKALNYHLRILTLSGLIAVSLNINQSYYMRHTRL